MILNHFVVSVDIETQRRVNVNTNMIFIVFITTIMAVLEVQDKRVLKVMGASAVLSTICHVYAKLGPIACAAYVLVQLAVARKGSGIVMVVEGMEECSRSYQEAYGKVVEQHKQIIAKTLELRDAAAAPTGGGGGMAAGLQNNWLTVDSYSFVTQSSLSRAASTLPSMSFSHASSSKAAFRKEVEQLVAELPLGPLPVDGSNERQEEALADLRTLFAVSRANLTAYKAEVIDVLLRKRAEAGEEDGKLVSVKGPSMKKLARSKEKVAKEYSGDTRRLKDVLRAAILVPSLTELMAVDGDIRTLESQGVFKIVGLKNRYLTEASDLSGYRDVNYSLLFNGSRERPAAERLPNLICELQVQIQDFAEIKLTV